MQSSTTASAPLKPNLAFEVNKLPKLVSDNVYFNRLLPWCDPKLRPDPASLKEGLPPWSLSLESYYRIFHPYTWIFLGCVYDKQVKYLGELEGWISRREEEGAKDHELEKLQLEFDEARKVAWRIFGRVYGLHYLRQQFLRPYRERAPGWSVSKILSTTVDFEVSSYGPREITYAMRIQEYSVWPLPLAPPLNPQWPPTAPNSSPPALFSSSSSLHNKAHLSTPPDPSSTSPTASKTLSPPISPPSRASLPSSPSPLVCMARLPATAQQKYVLPRFNTEWHKNFKAMSFDEFEESYRQWASSSKGGAASHPAEEREELVDEAYWSWEMFALKKEAEQHNTLRLLKETGAAAADATKRFLGLTGTLRLW